MHVSVDGAGGGIVDVIEEYARDGNVGFCVAGPVRVDGDVGRYVGEGAEGVICVYIAERLDVLIAV